MQIYLILINVIVDILNYLKSINNYNIIISNIKINSSQNLKFQKLT